MTGAATTNREVISRLEHYRTVGSTNDVVRDWLAAGEPEVCVAVADEQSAGRGRDGRTWTAPAGAALLLSLGFRPTWIEPDRVWRIAATVGLVMAEAVEEIATVATGTIRLKWPNDLVVGSDTRKLAGILGESSGLGSAEPRVVVGIGVNVDWPAATFPEELAGTMTSARELSGVPVDRERLFRTFVTRLGPRIEDLRAGQFDVAGWLDRQVTTGRSVVIDTGDGLETADAIGVDPDSGALIVSGPAPSDGERLVHAGEVRHVRLSSGLPGAAAAARV